MKTLEETEVLFPSSLEEALELMVNEATRGVPLAGGTDLMVQWRAGVQPPPERIIDLSGISTLRRIEIEGNDLLVGGGATFSDLRRSQVVQQRAPALAEAAATVGGVQIQNAGTLAGSMANASPAGDPGPPLLITDGTVEVANKQRSREIPLASFWTGYRRIDLAPDELIVRVRLPSLPEGHTEHFRKLGPRGAQAISKIMGAYRGQVRNGRVIFFRVALGSVAPTAIRLRELEKWVTGRPLDEKNLSQAERMAAKSVSPIDDIRSTADYRRWVAGRLVRGYLEELAGTAR